jgi:hypothetical protein
LRKVTHRNDVLLNAHHIPIDPITGQSFARCPVNTRSDIKSDPTKDL